MGGRSGWEEWGEVGFGVGVWGQGGWGGGQGGRWVKCRGVGVGVLYDGSLATICQSVGVGVVGRDGG